MEQASIWPTQKKLKVDPEGMNQAGAGIVQLNPSDQQKLDRQAPTMQSAVEWRVYHLGKINCLELYVSCFPALQPACLFHDTSLARLSNCEDHRPNTAQLLDQKFKSCQEMFRAGMIY